MQGHFENGWWDTEVDVRPQWVNPDGTNASAYYQENFIVNEYDLSKEFPALTIRPVPFENVLMKSLDMGEKSNNVKT